MILNPGKSLYALGGHTQVNYITLNNTETEISKRRNINRGDS